MKFKNKKFIVLFLISNFTVVTGTSCGQKEKTKETEPTTNSTSEALAGTRENSETYARTSKKKRCDDTSNPKDTNKSDFTPTGDVQSEGAKGDEIAPNLENSEFKSENSGKDEVTRESSCAK